MDAIFCAIGFGVVDDVEVPVLLVPDVDDVVDPVGVDDPLVVFSPPCVFVVAPLAVVFLDPPFDFGAGAVVLFAPWVDVDMVVDFALPCVDVFGLPCVEAETVVVFALPCVEMDEGAAFGLPCVDADAVVIFGLP